MSTSPAMRITTTVADHDLSLFDSIYGTSNNQHIREGTTLLDRENFSIIYECGIINESFTVINLKVTNKMSHSSGHSEQFCKPDVFAININGVTYDAYTGLESCSEEIIAEGASATVTIVISAGYSDGLTAIHTLAADILVWTGIFSDGKYHLGCSGDGSCNGRFYYSVFPEISDNQRYIYMVPSCLQMKIWRSHMSENTTVPSLMQYVINLKKRFASICCL